jgi:hypothetical protein
MQKVESDLMVIVHCAHEPGPNNRIQGIEVCNVLTCINHCVHS